jgi:hypothetical protein
MSSPETSLAGTEGAGTSLEGTGGASLDPYTAILELSERELELASLGKVADLQTLSTRWDQLTASLPARPPSGARGLLERARAIHQSTHLELLRLREAMLCDLRTTAQASRAASGYAAQARRRSRALDRSA